MGLVGGVIGLDYFRSVLLIATSYNLLFFLWFKLFSFSWDLLFGIVIFNDEGCTIRSTKVCCIYEFTTGVNTPPNNNIVHKAGLLPSHIKAASSSCCIHIKMVWWVIKMLILMLQDGEHVLEDRNKSNDWRLSRDIIDQSETLTESYNYLSKVSIADLEQRISRSWTKHSISK